MAEITTHIFFSKDIQKKFNTSDSIKLFSLGPDVFYFSHNNKKLARVIHKNNTLQFFKNYIKYIKDNHLENDEEVIGSLYGFLSHYVLDSTIHPYIFYKTFLKEGMHRVYEMSLSKFVLTNNNVNPNLYKITDDLVIKKNKVIVELLNKVLKDTYNIDNGGKLYYRYLRNLKIVYMLFRRDRFGIKKTIYNFMDKFYKKKIYAMSFHNIEDVDFNFDHKVWHHPFTNEESNKSLIDLYKESYKKVYILIDKVNLVLKDKMDINKLDNIIENRSLISGIDCNDKSRMKYFES